MSMNDENTPRRFIVTLLVETEGQDPSGHSVYAIDSKGGYFDNILESSWLEIAPWDDGSDA